jgi:hypothetical protein
MKKWREMVAVSRQMKKVLSQANRRLQYQHHDGQGEGDDAASNLLPTVGQDGAGKSGGGNPELDQ